eukprot:GHVT01027082.1.p1 GENE.GHVT01027082.1~~GHVT01027082.1.p1  ORF type:complete len:136 (+),score=0.38 GHVT01027082.1:184-591(+)
MPEGVRGHMNGCIFVANSNGFVVNSPSSNNWRTSLVPAPAVIPAPIAYVKVVAVKTLVVGGRPSEARVARLGLCSFAGAPGCEARGDVGQAYPSAYGLRAGHRAFPTCGDCGSGLARECVLRVGVGLAVGAKCRD